MSNPHVIVGTLDVLNSIHLFNKRILRRAGFIGLTGAVLTGALLTGAVMSGAFLFGAVMSRALLTGAVMSGALLSGLF